MRCLAVASRVLEAQGHLCLPGALVGRVSWCDTHGLPASESYYEPVTHLPAPSGWGLRIHWENMWGFLCAPWNKGSLDVVKSWLSIGMERVSRNQREQAVPVVREFTSRRLLYLLCRLLLLCENKTEWNKPCPCPQKDWTPAWMQHHPEGGQYLVSTSSKPKGLLSNCPDCGFRKPGSVIFYPPVRFLSHLTPCTVFSLQQMLSKGFAVCVEWTEGEPGSVVLCQGTETMRRSRLLWVGISAWSRPVLAPQLEDGFHYDTRS